MEHGASLTLTVKLLAFVASHLLVLLAALLLLALQLHACPPTYMALIDPPCEFAALALDTAVDPATQVKQLALRTLTARSLAVVAAHVLLLLAAMEL